MAIGPVIRTAEYQVDSALESEERRRGNQQQKEESSFQNDSKEDSDPKQTLIDKELRDAELVTHNQILDTQKLLEMLKQPTAPLVPSKNRWKTKQAMKEKQSKLR